MNLYLLGGGLKNNFDENESKILEKIVNSTGARNVVLVPTASTLPVGEVSKMYVPFLKNYGVETIYTPRISSKSDAEKPEYLTQIEEADLVLFSGGDQNRLVSVLEGTQYLNRIKERFTKDLSIVGNSAGAMAMPNPMITPDSKTGNLKNVPGLGILNSEGVYSLGVDTHLFAKSRIPRQERDITYLLNPINGLNTIIGIGEDTALFVSTDSKDAKVVGNKEILINQRLLDEDGSIYVKIKRFVSGQELDLNEYLS